MATRRQIAEQALKLRKGKITDDSNTSIREVMLLVDQVTMSLFKFERFENLNEGEMLPDSTMITEYELDVTENKTEKNSYSTLDVYPISLPMDMGVYAVYPKNKPLDQFIPIHKGARAIMSNLQEGDLEGLIGYERKGKKLIFTHNLKQGKPQVDKVIADLLVIDPSKIGADEPYPISGSMEVKVVEEVVKLLSAKPLADNSNDDVDEN